MKIEKILSRKYKGKGEVADWRSEFATFSTFVCSSLYQRGDSGFPLSYSDYDVIVYLCGLVGIAEVERTTGYTRKEIKALHAEIKEVFPPSVIKGRK